jgi:NRPS condensation-like uncharacterized protein
MESRIKLKNQVSGAPTKRKTKRRAGKNILKNVNQKAVFSLKNNLKKLKETIENSKEPKRVAKSMPLGVLVKNEK